MVKNNILESQSKPKRIGFKALLHTIGDDHAKDSQSPPSAPALSAVGSNLRLPPLKDKSKNNDSEIMKLIQTNVL